MPEWITRWDTARCYVLPDTVRTTIARSGSGFDLGAWHVARGVLVETALATGATAVALDYDEHLGICDTRCCPDRLAAGRYIRCTARAELALPARTAPLLVEYSWRTPVDPRERNEGWSVTVDGATVAAATFRRPPTLPYIGLLTRRHLTSRR